MREIKFRAWNIQTKTMIDLKKITPLALNMDTDGLFIPFSGMPLMQYTELKDKNEVEIYEGDIVKMKRKGVEKTITVEIPFVYIWNFNGEKDDTWEIIGNIHENPELL